jgi:O-antigen/teichoic acid export membrane protein
MTVAIRSRRRGSLASDAMLGALGALLSTGLSGIASIVIARELGVTGRGRWAVIASLAVLVATIVSSGLPIAASYASARALTAERVRTVQAALTLAAVLSLLAGAGYLAIAAIIHPPAPTAAVIIAASIPAVSVCYTVTLRVSLTTTPMLWYAGAQIAASLLTLVAVSALGATTHLTVLMVVITSAAGQLAGTLVSLTALRRYGAAGPSLLIRATSAARILRPYLGYALITFTTLSLTQIVQRVDVLLVNGYRGPHAAGLYSVAVSFTDLLLVVPAALGYVMFRRGARSEPAHFSEALMVLRWTGGLAAVGSLAVVILASRLVPLIFGPAYDPSIAPLRWLLPGAIAFSLQSVLSNYLASRGRPRVVLVAWLTGAVIGIGADLFVIPAYGIVGAAVVSSVSYIVVTGMHVKALRSVRPASDLAA